MFGQTEPSDIFHTNSVRVLPRALASKFPLYKAGQVLLSMRAPSAIAVLDLETRCIVWAAKGVWQYQHDAEFLDDGRLLLFDNLGSPNGSRVLEYDPVTQAIPWWYDEEKNVQMLTVFRGASQRLPNGNTMIVYAGGCWIVEVTPAKEVVWKWGFPAPAPTAVPTDAPEVPNFAGVKRYGPDELPFLKGSPRDPTK
jgi:hypothetical protein